MAQKKFITKSPIILLIIIMISGAYLSIADSCCAKESISDSHKSCAHDFTCSKCQLNQAMSDSPAINFSMASFITEYQILEQHGVAFSYKPSTPPPKLV